MKSATVASPLGIHISDNIIYIHISANSEKNFNVVNIENIRKQHQRHQCCQYDQHCQHDQCCHSHLVLTTSTGLATRVAVTPATAALAKWHLNLMVIHGCYDVGYHVDEDHVGYHIEDHVGEDHHHGYCDDEDQCLPSGI